MSKDRDPRTDPRDGDELCQRDGDQVLLVDMVRAGQVYYRVTEHGALVNALRVSISHWRWLAPVQCEPLQNLQELEDER